jgi:hypothetical protein
MKKLVLLLGLILPTLSIAQEKQPYSRKGQGFVYWGYNRSTYTKSDITFIGQGYNFTLHDVVAKDAPSPLGREYYDPALFQFLNSIFVGDISLATTGRYPSVGTT